MMNEHNDYVFAKKVLGQGSKEQGPMKLSISKDTLWIENVVAAPHF